MEQLWWLQNETRQLHGKKQTISCIVATCKIFFLIKKKKEKKVKTEKASNNRGNVLINEVLGNGR